MDIQFLRNAYRWEDLVGNQNDDSIWAFEASMELDLPNQEQNLSGLRDLINNCLSNPNMVEHHDDVLLIHAKALAKFGNVGEALRIFQRISLPHLPGGLRKTALTLEMLYIQAQYYKRNLLDGFNSTSAAWHFVYKVIKNLYSRASLLSDHALYMCLNNTVDPSYVFKDSASKTEVQTLISEREAELVNNPPSSDALEAILQEYIHAGGEDNQGLEELFGNGMLNHPLDGLMDENGPVVQNGLEVENGMLNLMDGLEAENGVLQQNPLPVVEPFENFDLPNLDNPNHQDFHMQNWFVEFCQELFSITHNDVNIVDASSGLKQKFLDGFHIILGVGLQYSQLTWDSIITHVSGSTVPSLIPRLGEVAIKNFGDHESSMFINESCFLEIIMKMLMMYEPRQSDTEDVEQNDDVELDSEESLSSMNSELADD